MPPATVGAGPLMEPPFARTPLTVVNSRFVSKSHSTEPSFAEYARIPPSSEPENTTPGITVMAADCAALQPRPGLPHAGGGAGVYQTRSPVAKSTACRPPGCGRPTSAIGKYAWTASTAEPHSMPPNGPPWPARYFHLIAPCLSGSIA